MKPFQDSYLKRGLYAAIGRGLAAVALCLGAMSAVLAQEATPPGFRAYKLEHAQAVEFGAQLRKVLAAAPGKPEVLVDRQLNRVLVQGNEEAHRLTADLVRALDRAAKGTGEDEPPARPAPRAEGGRYKLAHISWREFEDQIRRLWGGRLVMTESRSGDLATVQLPASGAASATMQIDRARGEITFAGPPNIIGPWERVVRTLDVPPKNAGERTEIVPIHRADPAQVQYAVSLVRAAMRGLQGKSAASAPLPGGEAKEKKDGGELVSMIFQPRPRQAEQQEELPEDQPPPLPPDRGGDGGLLGPVQIEFIEGLDIIVIRGNKRDVDRVVKMIEDIEAESERTKPSIVVHPLRHVLSQTMADLVVQLYDQVLSSRQGRVTITPLVKPNSLLLIGRQESVDAVIELIERLDRPVAPQSQFRVFALKNILATNAQATLQTLYIARGGLSPQISVVAEARSNVLIVQASPRDMAEIAKVIQRIDVDDTAYSFELRIFRLKYTTAQDIAPVIQNALNGRAPAAGGGQQPIQPGQINPALAQGGQQQVASSTITFLTVDTEGGKLLKSGILSDALITADARNNSLVVRAPAKSMELIAAIIAQLDVPPAAEAQIKVFTIVNGDATNLATTLQQLFGVTAQGAQANLQAILQSATGSGETPLVTLRFAVDQRTNSIIASGTQGDLNVVEAVLLRLDEGDIESRKTTVYRLRNAPALDVANTINQLLTNQRAVQNLTLNVVSAFERMDREVIVVPEIVSNSLVVSATPRYFEEIRRVVEQLDARPPMVMIQVLIAEVRMNDVKELGIEMGLQDSLLFDRGIGVIGFPFNQGGLGNNADAASLATRGFLAPQGLSNLGVGRTNATLGYGGLVLSAGNESVNLLLRALHDQQRVQVLSRPQIMTLDNQPAFVQVGQRVPYIMSSQLTVNGTINNVDLINVGILLGVTPRISPDGLVVMEVNAEKSAVGPEAEGIPISINPVGDVIRSPRIDIQTAQTTISAKSGQTVVFSGLISKERANVTRRTPYLSDIPVLGNLFRFDTELARRAELLIILTPYVVRGEEDADWVKRMEADRMSWCLSDVVEIHQEGKGLSGNRGPWGSEATPVIYPDMDPTGMEFVPTPAMPGQPVQPQLRPELMPPDRSGSSRRMRSAASETAAPAAEPQPPAPPSFSSARQSMPAMPISNEATTKVWLGPAPASANAAPPAASGQNSPRRDVAPAGYSAPANHTNPAGYSNPSGEPARLPGNYYSSPERLPEVE